MLSILYFFAPSYVFKMNLSFINNKKLTNSDISYGKFLNKSLKKFIEYQP